MDILKKIFPIIAIWAISILAVLPLFQDGYFPMHDDVQPTRIYEMAQALKSNQIPARIVGNLGYGLGYPLFNFYAPLPYYFGAIITLVGLPLITATKITFAVGLIFAGISMYLFSRKIWGEFGGILSGTLYLLAPYHAVQLYVRGAVGELWAYSFLPLLFLGIYYLLEKKNKVGMSFLTLGLVLILLSHNISGMIVMGFSLVVFAFFALISIFSKKIISLPYFGLSLFLALCVSSFFWVPALFESGYTNVSMLSQGTNHFSNHFVYLDQFWDSPWGFAGSAAGRNDGMSFMFGKAQIIFAIIGFSICVGYLFLKKKLLLHKKNVIIIFLCLSCGLFLMSLFLMTQYSSSLWYLLSPMSFIQYPWRFITFCVFSLSFIAGGTCFAFQAIDLKVRGVILAVVLILIGLQSFYYFKVQLIYKLDPQDYSSQQSIRWFRSKISDEYLPAHLPLPRSEKELPQSIIYATSSNIDIEHVEEKPHFAKIALWADTESQITVWKANFPGWRAYIDSSPTQIVPKAGLISLTVPQGKHMVTLAFTNTFVRGIANGISFVSMLGWILFLSKNLKITYEKN